jgi:hypothetical protein
MKGDAVLFATTLLQVGGGITAETVLHLVQDTLVRLLRGVAPQTVLRQEQIGYTSSYHNTTQRCVAVQSDGAVRAAARNMDRAPICCADLKYDDMGEYEQGRPINARYELVVADRPSTRASTAQRSPL